ncbi:MAG TPA: hypothetical protein VIW23_03765 [Candidatus Acidoferrum sp.]|jgi:hypothetical protein
MDSAKVIDGKKPTHSAKRLRATGALPLIGYGYLVVVLFLVVFFLSLPNVVRLSPELNNPRWSLLIALMLVLPLLLPAFKYVAPYVKSIKISDVEVSFAQVEVVGTSLTTLAEQLKTAAAQINAPEYASMMTSYSSVIIETIKEVQKTKDEVLVVDLREGNAWIPPNLYFLASLAADRTAVRQVAFVETRHAEEAFVGMCFPDDLRKVLAQKFPVLNQAAEQSKYQQLPLDQIIGLQYFQALHNLYAASPGSTSPKDSWLDSAQLFALAGSYIQRQKIECKESLTECDYRLILNSNYPYTAVVKDELLESLISRDRVALLVARNLAAKSTA